MLYNCCDFYKDLNKANNTQIYIENTGTSKQVFKNNLNIQSCDYSHHFC